jgi:hypothetical protein
MLRGTKILLLATAATATIWAETALAADLPVKAPPPAFEEWNPWLIRLRAVGV